MTEPKVDAFASERHYLDHVAAVWRQIPAEYRGTLYAGVPKGGHARAVSLGLDHQPCRVPRQDGRPILVASYGDERACAGRPVALLEHGAGQHYGGQRASTDDGAFAGGPGREAVGLFLCPNVEVAERNAATYPAAEVLVVGSPRLAPYLRRLPCFCAGPAGAVGAVEHGVTTVAAPFERATACDWHGDDSRFARLDPPMERPVVAVSFHWRCQTWPEAGTALDHYRTVLPKLGRNVGTLLGHSHPRIWAEAVRLYNQHGIRPTQHFDDVLDFADCYVVDNSSTLYEFAAVDRPVVVLNAPAYRRNVEHGLRFWSHADVGIQVDEPAELGPAIWRALDDEDAVAARRRAIVDEVFPEHPDGPRREAADLFAATAVAAWCESVTG